MSRHDERRRVVDMKQLPFIIVVVAVLVAYVFVWKKEPQGPPAAKEPVKELTLEEKIVGAYEFDNERSQQIVVFHDSGKMESYENGKKEGKEFRWKVVGGEVHAEYKDGYGSMWRIEPDGSLMQLGPLMSGQRHYLPRLPRIGDTDYQPYWKKITDYEEKIKKAASLRRQNTTKVESKKTLSPEAAAAALAKEQSEIIEEAVRMHLHAKTGFAAGKEIKGELTNADLERVTALGFSFAGITNEGLKEVVAKLPKLPQLSLRACKQITDAGLKEVAKLQNLTWLSLNGTQITDAGLKEVAKMKQLKELDLKNTKTITKEGVAELQKALPKCKILWP